MHPTEGALWWGTEDKSWREDGPTSASVEVRARFRLVERPKTTGLTSRRKVATCGSNVQTVVSFTFTNVNGLKGHHAFQGWHEGLFWNLTRTFKTRSNQKHGHISYKELLNSSSLFYILLPLSHLNIFFWDIFDVNVILNVHHILVVKNCINVLWWYGIIKTLYVEHLIFWNV